MTLEALAAQYHTIFYFARIYLICYQRGARTNKYHRGLFLKLLYALYGQSDSEKVTRAVTCKVEYTVLLCIFGEVFLSSDH